MFKLKLICIIGVIIFFASCSSQDPSKKKYSEIAIDNSQIKENENISGMIDSISITPLFEEDGNHIGSIFKILFLKSKYIVYDRISTNKILLFDDKGLFIKTIVKAGDGAQDPLNITDCWLNEENELEVYDFAQMKIFHYDSLFNLKSIVKSNLFNHFVSLRVIPSTKQYVGYANYSDFNKPFNNRLYNIAFLDTNLTIINTDKNFDKTFQGITWPMYSRHFYNFKDTLRFVKSYDNFVYNILNTKITERFKIIYKENSLPDDVMSMVKAHLGIFKDRNIHPNIKANYFKNYVRFNGLWLECDKYIFISSRDTSGKFGTPFYSLIDKINNKELFSSRNMSETIKYKLILPPFEYYNEMSNEFISIVNGFQLKDLILQESQFQQKIVSNLNIFYLLKVKLK